MKYTIHLVAVLGQVLPLGEIRTMCGGKVIQEHAETPTVISQVTCPKCRDKYLELIKQKWAEEEGEEVQHG